MRANPPSEPVDTPPPQLINYCGRAKDRKKKKKRFPTETGEKEACNPAWLD